jgi:hypothetical protein
MWMAFGGLLRPRGKCAFRRSRSLPSCRADQCRVVKNRAEKRYKSTAGRATKPRGPSPIRQCAVAGSRAVARRPQTLDRALPVATREEVVSLAGGLVVSPGLLHPVHRKPRAANDHGWADAKKIRLGNESMRVARSLVLSSKFRCARLGHCAP